MTKHTKVKEKYKLFKAGKVILKDKIVQNIYIGINNKKIVYLGKQPPKNITSVASFNFQDYIIAPGFIDIHLHGGGGREFSEFSEESLRMISLTHAHFGTTGLIPTLLASPEEDIFNFLSLVKKVRQKNIRGAKILGAGIEGPYISKIKKGAQPEEFIKPVELKGLRKIVSAGKDILKIMTFAPELKNADKLIKILKENNIIAAIGHSNANFCEVENAKNLGATHFTHFFNAMRGFNHREPGVVGAGLIFDDLSVEVIADGVHILPVVLKFLTKVKPLHNIVLITDARGAAGTEFASLQEAPRFADGTLTGSYLTMNKAVKIMWESSGVPLWEVIKMASLNPARVIGIDDKKGSIEVNKDADLVVMDEEFKIYSTVVEGEII